MPLPIIFYSEATAFLLPFFLRVICFYKPDLVLLPSLDLRRFTNEPPLIGISRIELDKFALRLLRLFSFFKSNSGTSPSGCYDVDVYFLFFLSSSWASISIILSRFCSASSSIAAVDLVCPVGMLKAAPP